MTNYQADLQDGFLLGPRQPQDIVIDPIFEKSFSQVWRDYHYDYPNLPCTFPAWESDLHPEYHLHLLPNGLGLSKGGKLVGGYLGCDLAILPEHQGLGLGAELVLETILHLGTLPVWEHDKPSFSPAGAGAHRAAWRLAADPGFLLRKLRRLAGVDRISCANVALDVIKDIGAENLNS